jgi:uncharacterized damage-inducible protein DinB
MPVTSSPSQHPELATPAVFLEISRQKLLELYWPRLRTCVELLSDEQVWWRPNNASNSIGNLLLHLDGNVRQWLVTSFNREDDNRVRPAEFDARATIARSVLLDQLGATLRDAAAVLSRLTEENLLARFEVQGYSVTGLEAVYHVVEHFSMHYGQILYATKFLRSEDLGFYRELNATGRAPDKCRTATTSTRGYEPAAD